MSCPRPNLPRSNPKDVESRVLNLTAYRAGLDRLANSQGA